MICLQHVHPMLLTGHAKGTTYYYEHMSPLAGSCSSHLRYTFYLASWKKAEESLRRINKSQKSTFSLFGSARPAKDDKARDDERIRTQMIIDVNAFGQDAQALGVDVEACETFRALREIVHSSLTEG
jgi:hypothetical protein